MKHKTKHKPNDDFRQLRTVLFLRTAAMLAAAAIAVYALYTFLLRGHFAGWMVALFQCVFGVDYDAALALYRRTFHRWMDALLWLSMMSLFVALFCIYLRWFTRYFAEIGRGMDALLENTPGELSLSPELFAIERKMNLAKRTIERQQSDMRTAEQRKNDLMMYLAHDLKTPLATSISYLNLLRDEKQLSEALREKYLSIALSRSERLEDLINEFLEIAKYDLSGITLQYSEIDLARLLEQLVYEFGPILAEKNLRCRLETADHILLNCDAGKMQRVFDNLLRNAAAYSFAGSAITVSAEKSGEFLTVRFSNHGSTIPKEKLERIFEQFFRLDPGRGSDGAGLGLAIARQIVTLHKGTISASSDQNLTVFTVTLPALQENR